MAISARAIRAGAAYVELLVNDNKMVRGLLAAQRKFKRFGSAITAMGTKLGALGVGLGAGFLPAIKAASNLEETMNKFDVVFGDNARAVKQWADDYASQVGRSQRQVADFLAASQDLLVPIGIDETSATAMSKQLTQLAVDLASFNNMEDADVLRDLQAALTGSSETMKKYGVIVNVAAVNQELLNQSIDPKNATEAQKAMARLRIFMEGTTAAQGDAIRSAGSFANQMKAVQGSAEDAGAAIGGALLPVITPLVEKARAFIDIASKWIKENQGLVLSIAKIVAVVIAAGAGLIIVGTLFTSLGAIVGAFTGLLTLAGTAIGLVGTALAAMMSPIGLVIGGLGTLGAVILSNTGAGGAALDWLKDKFGVLKDDALSAFEAIKNAMAAGDMGLAAEILWTTLKVMWKRGVNFLREKWFAFKGEFLRIGTDAAFGLLSVFNNAWANIRIGWADLTGWLAKKFIDFGAGIKKAWNTVSGFIRKAWAKVKATVKGTSAEADLKRIDDETKVENEKEDSKAREANKIIEDDKNRKQSEIDSERAKLDSTLFDEARRINQQRQKEFDAELAKDEEDLEGLKGKWQKLIAEANSKKTAADDKPEKALPELPVATDPQEQLKTQMKAASKRSVNTAVELGSSEAQRVILDALTGRNSDPQKDIAKHTKDTAAAAKKSQKDIARQTDLMRSGVRLIVDNI